MTAFTDSYGFNKGNAAAIPWESRERAGVAEVLLDFAAIAAARVAAGVAALAAADTLDIMVIPAGYRVAAVAYKVEKAEGATFTFDLGDASSATGWFSNADGNAAVGTMACTALALTEGTPNTVTGYSAGKFYSADGVLRITIDHNSVDLAQIRVSAHLVRMCP